MQFENKNQMIFSAASTSLHEQHFPLAIRSRNFSLTMVRVFIFLLQSPLPTYYVRRTSTNRPIPFTRTDMWKMSTVQHTKRMNLLHMENNNNNNKTHTDTSKTEKDRQNRVLYHGANIKRNRGSPCFKMIAIRQFAGFWMLWVQEFLFAYAKQNAISKCDYLFARIFVDALLLCLFIASDSIR